MLALPHYRPLGGSPFCRHGRTGPRTARTVQPSPSRISSVAGLADSWAPLSCRPCLPFIRSVPNSRVPSLHRHYPASSLLRTHPPPSRLRLISRWTGYTTYLASADFSAGRGGFLQLLGVSLSPCCRSHPAGVDRRVSQTATTHAAFAFTVAGSASGALHFRGHLCVRLRYGLETRPHPEDEAVERLQKVGFPSPCSLSYRALAFPLVGFPPTEHTSLRWTHNRTYTFRRIRQPC